MTRRIRVLVTDGFWRKSLSAVRALGARSDIDVFAGEMFRLAPALFARHLRGTWVYPSPLTRPSAFLRHLRHFIRRESIDVLLPMEESTLLLVMRHIASLPVRVPFPKAEVIEKARDKALVLGVAQGLGIPIPLTLFDGPPGKDSPFPLPALVKPRISSGARGIAVAADREGLALAYHQVARRFPRPLVQERLPPQGEGIGVSLLLSPSGRLLASFTHRRLREYPVAGGASTLRESARLPIVEKQALALLEALGFRGLAMVEFKRDVRDGSYRLMEVNPRFWGSLALAVSAGVNFPSILVDSALDRPPEPPPAYRTGVRCRWLLPGDLLHFLANPSRFRIEPSFGKFFGPDLHYDILSREDPYPALARILSFLPLLGSKDLRRFLRR